MCRCQYCLQWQIWSCKYGFVTWARESSCMLRVWTLTWVPCLIHVIDFVRVAFDCSNSNMKVEWCLQHRYFIFLTDVYVASFFIRCLSFSFLFYSISFKIRQKIAKNAPVMLLIFVILGLYKLYSKYLSLTSSQSREGVAKITKSITKCS